MTELPCWSRSLVVLAAAALLAAGCGGDDDGGADGGASGGEAECPDGDHVLMAMPYEANQPAGENWRLGAEMAVAEINEAGGILDCQVELGIQDTQTDADVS